MKNKVFLLILLSSFLIFGTACKSKTSEPAKETGQDSAFTYTFDFEEHDYQFRLLNGWIKFPDKDSTIAFLVANKDKKAFMSAGFEEKKGQTLNDYQKQFVIKINEADGKIEEKPIEKELNGLPAYFLGFKMKDAKNRWLTYRSYLIETDKYFINLAAWTSDPKPTADLIKELDEMLSNFKELK